ncbi:MAG: hypothetical protein V4478_00695 [Patescibacteria group bacterium]
MADAPASGGGSGWGALEVILALVLAIGLISTLTGNPITPIFGPSKTGSSAKSAAATKGTAYGCTVVVSEPSPKEKIGSEVKVSGTISACADGGSSFPKTIYAQVVDSKGTVLSVLTPLPISKNFFGEVRFSAAVTLSGIARSSNATLIITGPATDTAKSANIRVAITLKTGIAAPAPINTDANFVPAAGYMPTATPTPAPTQPQPVYTPPQQVSPVEQTPPPSTGSGNGGGTGTTF